MGQHADDHIDGMCLLEEGLTIEGWWAGTPEANALTDFDNVPLPEEATDE